MYLQANGNSAYNNKWVVRTAPHMFSMPSPKGSLQSLPRYYPRSSRALTPSPQLLLFFSCLVGLTALTYITAVLLSSPPCTIFSPVDQTIALTVPNRRRTQAKALSDSAPVSLNIIRCQTVELVGQVWSLKKPCFRQFPLLKPLKILCLNTTRYLPRLLRFAG
jgi:hypothetical protein